MPITQDTEILTNRGWKSAANVLETQDNQIFNASTGGFDEGFVSSNKQWDEYWTYTLVPYHNSDKTKRTWTFDAPRPCHLPLIDGGWTYDLRVGDTLQPNTHDCGLDPESWGHGFMYRFDILSPNGLDPRKYPLYQERLISLKTQGKITAQDGSLPEGKTPMQLGSFIRGYLAADGHKSTLATPNQEFYQFFLENHGYAGLILTGAERIVRKFIKIDRKTKFFNIYEVHYSKAAEFTGFRVLAVSGPSETCRPLYSVHLPEGGNYVINGGWTVASD